MLLRLEVLSKITLKFVGLDPYGYISMNYRSGASRQTCVTRTDWVGPGQSKSGPQSIPNHAFVGTCHRPNQKDMRIGKELFAFRLSDSALRR